MSKATRKAAIQAAALKRAPLRVESAIHSKQPKRRPRADDRGKAPGHCKPLAPGEKTYDDRPPRMRGFRG